MGRAGRGGRVPGWPIRGSSSSCASVRAPRGLESLPARRSVRPRAHQLGVRNALRAHGPQWRRAHGVQLLRARHREHGDPRRARHREQKERWLQPLLDGEIRSCFSMTEPETAGLRPHPAGRPRGARGRRVGDQRPQVVHVGLQRRLGGDRHGGHRPRRAAAQAGDMILVPIDTPGLRGDPAGPGDGTRRGSRSLGGALRGRARARRQRARGARRRIRHRAGPPRPGTHPPLHAGHRLGRARVRAHVPARARAHAFGGPLAEKQFVQDFIAKSRMDIDSARLMVLHAAWKMDTEGKRAARQDISMIKVIAAQMHQRVVDRAMQVHGALGMSDDTPLAAMWRQGRWLRIADGPDEVHKMVIALRELNRFKPREPAAQRTLGQPRSGRPGVLAPTADHGLTDEQQRLRRGAPRLRGSASSGPSRREDAHSDEVAGPDGRARLVRASDPRGVRRLGRQLLRRHAVPRGDRARPDTRGRLRRHADRGRRAQALRHRGAEAATCSTAWRRAARWRSRCPSPRRARTWPP